MTGADHGETKPLSDGDALQLHVGDGSPQPAQSPSEPQIVQARVSGRVTLHDLLERILLRFFSPSIWLIVGWGYSGYLSLALYPPETSLPRPRQEFALGEGEYSELSR